MLDDNISDEDLIQMVQYCEKHHKRKERFVSASGDLFDGYLAHAENVVIDKTEIGSFYYYLVFENKRDIALLGFDFIDNCERCASAHGDIVVTKFDEVSYGTVENALGADEFISLIDSLSDVRKQ